jgi:DNA-binding transcriptional LysR family regulator
MAKPGLDDVWLYCAMVRRMRERPDGRLTYKKLANRIRVESEGSVARRLLWTADVAVHNLRRCASKFAEHFGQDLLREGPEGELVLQEFGTKVYDLFQPTVERMLALYEQEAPAAPVHVRVHDSLACEIIPGALRRLRHETRTPDGARFRFGTIDYQTIEEEIRERQVAFGVGWAVPEGRWSALETAPFGPPLAMAFVASPREVARAAPDGGAFLDAIRAAGRLFVLDGDLKLPGLEDALHDVDASWIVEVTSFRAVLMHARHGDGVGVLPLLPWVLDGMRESGHLVYAPVPGAGHQQMACYLPRGGEEALDGHARQLLEAIRDNFGRLYQAADFEQDQAVADRARGPTRRRPNARPGART